MAFYSIYFLVLFIPSLIPDYFPLLWAYNYSLSYNNLIQARTSLFVAQW